MPTERKEQVRKCPKCRKPMKAVLKEDIEVDVCESCKGVWVDFFEEKTLLNMKPEVFTVDELRRLRKLYQPLGRIEKTRYVPCPICKELMRRKNWGAHSGIVVDRCEKHGTWYDEGELEKIQEFVKLGGVEFEKLRLTEKGLTRLESKLDQEITRLHLKTNSVYRRARLYSMVGL